MINVAIVVNDRCQASSVFTVIDLILAANFAYQNYFNGKTPLFSHQLVGLTETIHAYNGSPIGPVVQLEVAAKPDIVILPGAFESVLPLSQSQHLLAKMPALFTRLKSWHQQGSLVASICTGNFILASAGIAQGRSLTCHWASKKNANGLFPHETFDTDQLLIDHGDIVSAGGALAVSQLVLYLIARCHSRELALVTGKLMMVEFNLDNQSRFAIFRPTTEHGDALVSKLQQQIESSFNCQLALEQFADQQGIGPRQLSRRFKKATGETPLSYQQRFRVEKVKMGLESSNTAVNKLIWQVGYEDLTSFRRLFKRYTGLTMQQYRRRFS